MTTKAGNQAGAEPMELGGLYQIPHVRAPWPDGEPNWIPVLGPRHNDAEIINFEPEHFHIDIRFLDDETYQKAENLAPPNSIMAINWVYQKVLATLEPETEDFVWACLSPQGEIQELYTKEPLELPLESWFRYQKVEYRREYPTHPTYLLPWIRELEKAYAKDRLKPDMKCPHRGTDLNGLTVTNNRVTCPLHGLSWNVRSGRLEPSP